MKTQREIVEKAFDDIGYQSLTIEQTGPDGTEVLGLLIFLSCPLCRSVVPANLEGVDVDHGVEHRSWHLEEAEILDELIEFAQNVSRAIAPPPIPPKTDG